MKDPNHSYSSPTFYADHFLLLRFFSITGFAANDDGECMLA